MLASTLLLLLPFLPSQYHLAPLMLSRNPHLTSSPFTSSPLSYHRIASSPSLLPSLLSPFPFSSLPFPPSLSPRSLSTFCPFPFPLRCRAFSPCAHSSSYSWSTVRVDDGWRDSNVPRYERAQVPDSGRGWQNSGGGTLSGGESEVVNREEERRRGGGEEGIGSWGNYWRRENQMGKERWRSRGNRRRRGGEGGGKGKKRQSKWKR